MYERKWSAFGSGKINPSFQGLDSADGRSSDVIFYFGYVQLSPEERRYSSGNRKEAAEKLSEANGKRYTMCWTKLFRSARKLKVAIHQAEHCKTSLPHSNWPRSNQDASCFKQG